MKQTSRRQLMAMGTAALAAGRHVARAQAQATPPAGALLRLAGPTDGLAVLDPALARDFQEMAILRQIYRGLLGYSQALDVVPEIAESFTHASDASSYTFTLRADARFHDGRAITARDIHASFVRALSPATAGGDAAGLSATIYLGQIKGASDVLAGNATTLSGFVIASDRRFTIALTGPDAAFPQKLASVPAAIVDASARGMDATPNGTGPFRVSAFTPGDSLLLAASDVWYGTMPEMTSLSYRLGATAGNPLNLFQAGEIDLLDGLAADQIDLLRDPASGAALGEVTKTDLFSLYYLAFACDRPPLDDANLRKALQLAFPRDQFAAAGGNTTAPARGFLPPGMLGEQWTANLPATDLDAARQAIARSRYGSAQDVPPITIYGGQALGAGPLRNVGIAMRDVVGASLGLAIDAVWVDWSDYLLGLPQRRFPTYSITWVADYPEPQSMLWVLFGSDSSENYSGYRSDAFDALLSDARAQPDRSRRAALYAAAQQQLIDDAAVIPIFFDIGYTVARPGLSGIPTTAIGMLGLETVRRSS